MKVKFSRKFARRYNKAPKKIKKAFGNRLDIFIKDKFHPQLNNHALSGKYGGYRSINITGDWRAIFQELQSGKAVYFVIIDTHSNLYR